MADIATWGIKTSNEVNYGIVQSAEYTASHKTGEVRNEKGQIVRIEQYDKDFSSTLTIVTTGTLPNVGDELTYEGKKMYISSIELIENNQQYQTARITAKATHKINEITEV